LIGRGAAFPQEGLADGNPARLVDGENPHRRPADWRKPDETGTQPCEVGTPFVATRVIKPDEFLRQRVDAGQVGTFVQVAVNATESEIRYGVAAAVLPGDDMVNLVTEPRS
jgi:hypothetical protein